MREECSKIREDEAKATDGKQKQHLLEEKGTTRGMRNVGIAKPAAGVRQARPWLLVYRFLVPVTCADAPWSRLQQYEVSVYLFVLRTTPNVNKKPTVEASFLLWLILRAHFIKSRIIRANKTRA